jgi:hypothetical protein
LRRERFQPLATLVLELADQHAAKTMRWAAPIDAIHFNMEDVYCT